MTSPKRSVQAAPSSPSFTEEDQQALRDILAHLNFSSGTAEPKFLAKLNQLWPALTPGARFDQLKTALWEQLEAVRGSSSVFHDCRQAAAVIRLTIDETLPAFFAFHRDLLFHLEPIDYENAFFLGRAFEAVLSQQRDGGETERIVSGAIASLNDYVGYRPVPVLENERQMELYPHERIAPIPLYVEGAGIAHGPYEPLIARTLQFLREAPQDLLHEAHLDPAQLREIVLDPRAHDHLHPVNKRTNYMFGEWDPHAIDIRGLYDRFVIRKIVLDAMNEWAHEANTQTSEEEQLFDAAAALCGTMVMASSVSGSGPDTHDSTVSLTQLLPAIARRRDEFYARLISAATGSRLKRLRAAAEETRQPFGHVRQHLNMHLAGYGARQVQHREVSLLFARMGCVAAAREHAQAIPAASIRIECEMLSTLSLARRFLRDGRVAEAAENIRTFEELLHRGIACGAIVDPWCILGFHGQFPLFAAREDAIPDNRIESLLDLMEDGFSTYSAALIEAAAQGEDRLIQEISARFQKLADWWDQFASDAIEDLPEVIGQDAWESATHVAEILREWRTAGESAGDVAFWKQHIERFQSAQAYGPVVDALLNKQDHIASFALLMQWLSQSSEVGCEGPQHSLFGLLIRWMKLVTRPASSRQPIDELSLIRRLFDYLEANAGSFWSVPTLDGTFNALGGSRQTDWLDDELTPEPGDKEEDVFQAAYEGVTFKDSAEDGHWGDTLDGDHGYGQTEFELLNRELEPRLKFLNVVGQLWQMAAARLATESVDDQLRELIEGWQQQSRRWEAGLLTLMEAIEQRAISAPSGDHDTNIEFDLQMQVKFYLLNQIIMTLTSLKNAEQLLSGCLTSDTEAKPSGEIEQTLADVFGAIVHRDAESVAQRLPLLIKQMLKRPLLYVPFDQGGRSGEILKAQTMQSVSRLLLRELPKLGLLRHTWHVLNTVYKMERRWRPQGQAITEFDRLFGIALRSTLEAFLDSVDNWPDSPDAADDLLNFIGELIEPFQQLWLRHSRTMRLSSVDGVRLNEDWDQLYEFIQQYGADLFHASQLTLGHVRAILQNGIGWYLDYLGQEVDPVRPIRLISDLEAGRIAREDAEWCLETIYSIVVDKFDRFLEYNTTTTQSDYGEMFYTLLDFLRLEARYDREAWNLTPLVTVHEVLCRKGKMDAARLWADMFEAQTSDLADQHQSDLQALETRHGMKMPAIADHLNQRFYKPLQVNEMLALVEPAVAGMQETPSQSGAFETLAAKVRSYLEGSWGSGIDIPQWIRLLDREVHDVLYADEGGRPGAEAEIAFPLCPITLREFRQQISLWRNALGGPSPKRGALPDSGPDTRKTPSGRKRKRGHKRK